MNPIFAAILAALLLLLGLAGGGHGHDGGGVQPNDVVSSGGPS